MRLYFALGASLRGKVGLWGPEFCDAMKYHIAMGGHLGWYIPVHRAEMADEDSMLGFLFSYWYCRKINMDELVGPLDPRPPLFADSGAFSAHTLGGHVDAETYGEWLHRWRHLFGAYSNLDVLGDVDAGLANQATLEGMGLAPVPVFHGGEPLSVLADFAARYDYIALGGIAAGAVRSGPKLAGWLDECFAICEGKAGLHGFGMTNWEMVRRYPWRSVDSSSIGSGWRFGTIKTYDPYGKVWRNWRLSDRAAWGRYGWLVREYRMVPDDFAEPRSRECTRALIRLATRSMRRAVDDLDVGQYYVADNAKPQVAGEGPRVEALNEGNADRQVYIVDTDLRPATVATMNEANQEDGAGTDSGHKKGPRPRRAAGGRARA